MVLRFHGDSYGWEAQIRRDGDLFISQRLIARVPAERWANEARKDRVTG